MNGPGSNKGLMSEQKTRRALNAQYNTAAADSLALRATHWMRRKMYERFIAVVQPKVDESLLDVGVTSDRDYRSSNYLEAWYPHKSRITAAGIDDAAFLEQLHPGLRFVRANGKALPFADNSFDVVHSSAVIEHVGSRTEQQQLLRELLRVARRTVCVTTPNRWFPVEVHTSIPLLHWLPAPLFRSALKKLGHDMLADEAHLNLLGASDLVQLCAGLGDIELSLHRMRLLGLTSNLVLFLSRSAAASAAPTAPRNLA